MSLYSLVRPALHLLEPETAHHLAILALRSGLVPRTTAADDPVLATRVFDLAFPNPIGLAAGFDKNAEIIDAVLELGFGFTEAGTVTPLPQPGNAGKRLFRLDEDEAVINRFGFNSEGLAPYVARFARASAAASSAPMSARTATPSMAPPITSRASRRSAGLADYLVVNISSPNTPGLRGCRRARRSGAARARDGGAARGRRCSGFRRSGESRPRSRRRRAARHRRSGDATGIDGLIVGNTTIERPPTLRSRDRAPRAACPASLCWRIHGVPVEDVCADARPHSDHRLRRRGERRRRLCKIRAGASLVQLYSAIVFHGPTLVVDIKRELAALLRADGFASVADADRRRPPALIISAYRHDEAFGEDKFRRVCIRLEIGGKRGRAEHCAQLGPDRRRDAHI